MVGILHFRPVLRSSLRIATVQRPQSRHMGASDNSQNLMNQRRLHFNLQVKSRQLINATNNLGVYAQGKFCHLCSIRFPRFGELTERWSNLALRRTARIWPARPKLRRCPSATPANNPEMNDPAPWICSTPASGLCGGAKLTIFGVGYSTFRIQQHQRGVVTSRRRRDQHLYQQLVGRSPTF